MKLGISKGQKQIILYIVVFAIGFGLCCALSQQGWTLCCKDSCDTAPFIPDSICELTCLTIHAQNPSGDPVKDVNIVLYWSNGSYLAGGVTNDVGDWTLNMDYFGCGGDALEARWNWEGIQGVIYGNTTISNTEASCTLDPVTGCCRSILIIS